MAFLRLVQLNLVFLLFFVACKGDASRSESNHRILRLAVTTSTRDSGLLDRLIPVFENDNDVQVKLVAVGSGKALRLGEIGEVDAVLVHAESAELKFLDAGHANRREPVMFNYFEILGPRSDPARIGGQAPLSALNSIRESDSIFVSRGDESGTHLREKQLWKNTGQLPDWKNYQETGQGMGPSLMIANQKRAYILCDRGTYLSMKDKIDLIPLTKQTDVMKNTYGVLCIDPKKNRMVQSNLANLFADFLIQPKTQKLISEFKKDGVALFFPLHPVH